MAKATEEKTPDIKALQADVNELQKALEKSEKARVAAETDLKIARTDVDVLSKKVHEERDEVNDEFSKELDEVTKERDQLQAQLADTSRALEASKAEVQMLVNDENRIAGFKLDAGPRVPMQQQIDSLGKSTPMSEGWKTFLSEQGAPVMYGYHGEITCRDDSVWSHQSIMGRAIGMVEQAFLSTKCGRRNPQTGSLDITEWPSFSTERSVNVLVWIK